jgi:hypothetical protein
VKTGDRVRFVGCSAEQTAWGEHTDPVGILTMGSIYMITDVEVHAWHTTIELDGISGTFNSVCFEENVQTWRE